jgi:hypothetical protein
MRDDTNQEKAVLHYAAAHAAHYKSKDLNEALELYTGVMTSHPDTREAEYSRTQIQNIAKSVVPKQELVDAEKKLIRIHLEHASKPLAEPAPAVST